MMDTITIDGRLYETTKHLQQRLGISHATFYRRRNQGLLPQPIWLRVGKQGYYDQEEADRSVQKWYRPKE